MKVALRLAFVGVITALAWFNLPAAIVAMAASIVAVLQGKADTLIEISFGPLKAKLEREVGEAEKLVKQLREISALQAKAVVAAGVRAGRWADEGDWLYHHVKGLEAALRELGVSEDQLVEARAEFVTYTISDAGAAAMGNGTIPSKDGKMLDKEWREAIGKFPNRDPDKIEAFLTTHGFMTDERAQRLDDMRWMKTHGDVRDVDQYLRARMRVPWE